MIIGSALAAAGLASAILVLALRKIRRKRGRYRSLSQTRVRTWSRSEKWSPWRR